MKAFFLSLVCCALLINGVAQEDRYELRFKPGQKTLSAAQEQELQQLVKKMRHGKSYSIYPITYDSRYGTTNYAKNARQQAKAIGAFVEKIGLTVLGYPTNFPSAHRGMSASVDVRYLLPDNEVRNPLKGYFPEKPSQFFDIDPTKDTTLLGLEGTVISIEANAIKASETVRVELKEFYALDDFIKSGLQTSSNGQFIETGGTVYLNAEEKETGLPVSIDQSKGIELGFADGQDKDDFQLFVEDNRTNGPINWVLPSEKKTTETWQMTVWTRDPEGNIVDQQVFNSPEAYEAYKAEQRRKAEEARRQREEEERRQREAYERQQAELRKQQEELRNKAQTEGVASNDQLENTLRAFDFGFINCDRFPSDPLIAFSCPGDASRSAEYYLVYTDVDGVITGRESAGTVNFGSVPQNRTATLIAVAFAGNSAWFYKSQVKPGQQPSVELKKVDPQAVGAELALLRK